jgi:arabinan endo-1,5-alpha-L-arabinosidase
MRVAMFALLPMVLGAIGGCAIASDGDDDLDEDEPTESEVSELSIRNPVQKKCADPSVMKDGPTYYLTCTGGDGQGNLFPIYASTDLLSWARAGEVFKKGQTPAWANGNWWAPELHHHGNGYVAVFSAKNKASGKNAVGIAFGASPKGPFVDKGSALVAGAVSSIDAHLIHGDDGKPILVYKNELFKNGNGADAILAVHLTDDAKSTKGTAKTILGIGQGWEGGVVEGGWMKKRGSFWYLFYSGNAYCNHTYAVGVARSRSPFGPFEKKGAPILKSGERWVGPGHNAITEGPDGRTWIVYHAYKLSEGTPRCGEPVADNDTRHTLVDRITWKNGWPSVSSRL